MSDRMYVQPLETLLSWILRELEANDSILGLPRALFYTPRPKALYAGLRLFGQPLATPVGPAAGPHTQLAQNIACAWLSGARFIELKTVQVMDELDIPRPCIDVAASGEGYNVEWSQELKLEQSAGEYVKAWALIHILHRLLGWEQAGPVGTVLNMSVGYNLAGIQSPAMQHFMDRLQDSGAEIDAIQELLRTRFPRLAGIPIPTCLTNNVTLSTMHGCPPDEIERIARYLLEERGLHTTVKLNPTLLGKETVLHILHDDLGYRNLQIPDSVFEHDLKYGRAVEMIRTLQAVAAGRGLTFGVKLSNTLAMANHRGVLPGGEMYMSGSALYPITIRLFHTLAQELGGDLNVSFSAGADALNIADILAAGACPVTAASDLLKPGGYSRLGQWLENLEADMRARGAESLEDLARHRLANLERAANEAVAHPRYKRGYNPFDLPKVGTPLELFDCIAAPCVEQCAVCQDVPEYAWLLAAGDSDRALEAILHRNPLPAVTGSVCTHLCQTRCTRTNYDEPVGIRDLKRFAAEHGRVPLPSPAPAVGRRVAVVGSGPAGLAAAYFLALNGIQVTVFESREMAGGMLAIAPHFRLSPQAVQADLERIASLGVELRLGRPVTLPPEELLKQGFDAVYLGCGLQQDARLEIEGIDGAGAWGALRLLEQVARGERPDLGTRVLVIGGGNTAMDAARTAQRLTGRPATVVYRRTRAEMPCEPEELHDLLDEGNRLLELASPVRVIRREGRVAALECVRNQMGEPDADGRRRPIPLPGSEFQVEADAIVLAIGQKPDVAFLTGGRLSLRNDGTLPVDAVTGQVAGPVYAGGDLVRGPAIIIQACADGRRAAEAICRQLGVAFRPPPARMPELTEADVLRVKRARARKVARNAPRSLPAALRGGFDPVAGPLTQEQARDEAARCLQCSSVCDKCVEVCPNRANYAYRVEPVRWKVPLLACREGRLAAVGHEPFSVAQARQIVHVDDFCNECGNCTTFCVHQGKPYADKPRLFLRRADFEQEPDNAFYVAGSTIYRRTGGAQASVTQRRTGYLYEDGCIRASLTLDFLAEELSLKQAFEGVRSLRGAAEAALLLGGVRRSLPFLSTGE